MVIPWPPYRRLRAFTLDPSLATKLDTALINQTTLRVPWERDAETGKELLRAGPIGEYLEVVDFDPASECFYAPVDLNEPHILAQDGLTPSEGDPKFHQQQVYAVAMTTIVNFERALGRKALWAPRLIRDPKTHEVVDSSPVEQLRIYPHALREPNAYYSPEKKALLFGYFPTSIAGAAEGLPGGLVFTCLSQDVVAHETTHALLDGLHRYFAESSNPDVLAFHEGFADVVALFQHFSQAEALRHQIAKTRGDLRNRNNLLCELAIQFGQAIGGHGALRDYIGKTDHVTGQWTPREPSAKDYPEAGEVHDRGAVLVAAMFDAFLAIYEAKTADLLRIATGGSGVLPEGNLHPDLINRLAEEAARIASHFLRMAIRALDYCPPVDITFGEYLRALITGDVDLVADDRWGYRVAVIEAFRRRGIYPREVRVLGQDVLRWQEPRGDMLHFADLIRKLTDPKNQGAEGIAKGSILPTMEWQTSGRRSTIEFRNNRFRTLTWLWMKGRLGKPEGGRAPASFARKLGLDLGEKAAPTIFRSIKDRLPILEIHSVRVARRPTGDGRTRSDLVIEMTQRRRGYLDEDKQRKADRLPVDSPQFEGEFRPDFTFRGGCTLLIDGETGRVRYAIIKDIMSASRFARQREFASDATPSLHATYDPLSAMGSSLEPFAMLHRSF